MKKISLAKALTSGLTALRDKQEKDGSFVSFSFSDAQKPAKNIAYHSPFATAFILDILTRIPDTQARTAQDRAADYLMKQRSRMWSFNYWSRDSKEAAATPYPDDLDDTFCALAALFHCRPALFTGNTLAKITKLLIAVEKRAGGPYTTWLVDAQSNPIWRDVDIAVNCNIAYFLSLSSIVLPGITALQEDAIKTKYFASPYYPSNYAIFYFLARSYTGPLRVELYSYVKERYQEEKEHLSLLEKVFALTTLLRLGGDRNALTPDIQLILSKQADNGLWPVTAFCIDPSRDHQTHYSGSETLTTAFCLELLSLYQESPSELDTTATRVLKQIDLSANARLHSVDQSFRGILQESLSRMIQYDRSQEIRLLPYHFARSFIGAHKTTNDKLSIDLGLANFYGWLAYSLYDTYFDNEPTDNTLSAANFFLRNTLTMLYECNITGLTSVATDLFDSLDQAYNHESRFYRLDPKKTYTKTLALPEIPLRHLSQRSIGHAVGPIAILLQQGYSYESPETCAVVEFFHHYLIARQLNDDAHDWHEDMVAGRLTPITVSLLSHWTRGKPHEPHDLVTIANQVKNIFWTKELPIFANQILNEIASAEEELTKIQDIIDRRYLMSLLMPSKHAAEKALQEHAMSQEYIAAFSHKEAKPKR